MSNIEDSAKGEKSFGVMIYEPPYTCPTPSFRRARPVRTGGVRGAFRHLMAKPSTRLAFGTISELKIRLQLKQEFSSF